MAERSIGRLAVNAEGRVGIVDRCEMIEGRKLFFGRDVFNRTLSGPQATPSYAYGLWQSFDPRLIEYYTGRSIVVNHAPELEDVLEVVYR